MARNYKYFSDDYSTYYDELSGSSSLSKVEGLKNNVQQLSYEFENVKSVIEYWRGQGASVMTSDAIENIMKKFNTTMNNINESLVPAADNMEKLIDLLKNLKESEDSLIAAEDSLAAEENKNVPKNIQSGKNEDGYPVYTHNPEYDTWCARIDELNKKINELNIKLSKLKAECDSVIGKIKDLESLIKEFSDYMAMSNTILGINVDFQDESKMSLEERLAYIEKFINNYTEVYGKLNDLYEKKYGKGFSFTQEDFKKLDFLFDAFDIYWMSEVDRNEFILSESNDGTFVDIDKLTVIMRYCDDNNVFDRITNYIGGKSWNDSGLGELYNHFFDTGSGNFLNLNMYNEARFQARLKEKYGITESKTWLKENFNLILNSYSNLKSSYTEYQSLVETMSVVQSQIDNLQNAKKLLPYEINMQSPDFAVYRDKSYDGYTLLGDEYLKVLSNDEVALYDYLYHTKSKAEADAYLKCMENAINQRIGAYNAAEYAAWISQDGFDSRDLFNSGFEGTKDGFRNFWNGLGDLFRVSSTEVGTKSALDYEMMYKQQYIQQLMDDPSFMSSEQRNAILGVTNLNSWYSAGTSVGNMIVPSLAGFIPVVGGPLSGALMTASIAGNTAVEARQEGFSVGQSYLYGFISGATETATEKFLGGIPGISKLEGNFIKDALSEGVEEFVQEYIDSAVRGVVLGETDNFNKFFSHEQFKNATQSGVMGVITSGVMQGGTQVAGIAVNAATRGISGGKYLSYGQFKNAIESSYYTTQARSTIDSALAKVENGGTLNVADQVILNRAVNNVSAQELAGIKSNLTVEQNNVLSNAIVSETGGITFGKSRAIKALELSNVVSSIDNVSTSISEVNGLNAEILSEPVTRDSITLADYIADTKPMALDNKAVDMLSRISPEITQRISDRIDFNHERIVGNVLTDATIRQEAFNTVGENNQVNNVSTNLNQVSVNNDVNLSNVQSSSNINSTVRTDTDIVLPSVDATTNTQNIVTDISSSNSTHVKNNVLSNVDSVAPLANSFSNVYESSASSQSMSAVQNLSNASPVDVVGFGVMSNGTFNNVINNNTVSQPNTIVNSTSSSSQNSTLVEFDFNPNVNRVSLNSEVNNNTVDVSRSVTNTDISYVVPTDLQNAITAHNSDVVGKFVSTRDVVEIAPITMNLSLKDAAYVRSLLPLDKKVNLIFAEGMYVATVKYDDFLKTFREHANKHTAFVVDYAIKMAEKFGDAVNLEEVKYGALCHDFGMRGGITKKPVLVDGKIKYLHEFSEISSNTLQEAEKTLKETNGEIARKNHPLNSALIVLSENVLPPGVDKDVVALLAMSHSKSTSGIKDFSNVNFWEKCVSNLKDATNFMKEKGLDITFDDARILEMLHDPKTFERLQNEAFAIRDADAMTPVATIDGNKTIMQNRGYSIVEVINPRTRITESMSLEARKQAFQEPVEYMTTEAEASSIVDTLYNGSVKEDIGNFFSKKIHAGELNVNFSSFVQISTDSSTKRYIAVAMPVDANGVPNATFDAIVERIGEVETYGNFVIQSDGKITSDNRDFVIALPIEAQGTALGNYYEKLLGNLISLHSTSDELTPVGKNLSKKDAPHIRIVYTNQTDSSIIASEILSEKK